MNFTVEQIVDLAKNVEINDTIDWTQVHVDRDAIYQIIGSQVYDMYSTWKPEERDAIALATITKLVVENFILNIQLEKKDYGSY